jgi:hypothetical protein
VLNRFPWRVSLNVEICHKWKGERLMAPVAIENIKAVLADHPGLVDVAVLAYEHKYVGEVLVAYVVSDGPVLNLATLQEHVRKMLPADAVPAAIMVVDSIPVTEEGTADARALPMPDLRGVLPYRAPGTPRQEAMCTIFAEVLGRARCGIDDDFFGLGGRSLDAVLIASRVTAAVGLEMSLNDLFDAPTVAELDRRLDGMAGS